MTTLFILLLIVSITFRVFLPKKLILFMAIEPEGLNKILQNGNWQINILPI